MKALLKNTAILSVGAIVVAVGNYAFHPIMARLLSISEFGELQSLMSLLYIVSVPSSTIATVAKKESAELFGQSEKGKIHALSLWLNKTFLLVGIVGMLLLLALSPMIDSFLKLESFLALIVLLLFFPFKFLTHIQLSILEGLHRFTLSSLNGIISIITKLALGTLMMYWWGVWGAMLALGIAGAVPYFLALYQTRDLSKHESKAIPQKKVFFKESIPIFFWILCSTLLFSWDIILAKHYLPAEAAGEYAALSIFGKIVLFGTGPIMQALFPMTAAGNTNPQKNFLLALQGLFLVSLAGVSITLSFLFIPDFLVMTLLGEKFLSVVPHLGLVGIIFTLLSLSITIINYCMSTGKWKGISIPITSIILMTLGIFWYHNGITEILKVMLMVEIFTFLSLLAYLSFDHMNKRYEQGTEPLTGL